MGNSLPQLTTAPCSKLTLAPFKVTKNFASVLQIFCIDESGGIERISHINVAFLRFRSTFPVPSAYVVCYTGRRKSKGTVRSVVISLCKLGGGGEGRREAI
jgi:hypothetical protein